LAWPYKQAAECYQKGKDRVKNQVINQLCCHASIGQTEGACGRKKNLCEKDEKQTITINLCEKEEKQLHKQQAGEVGAIILCEHSNQPV